MTPGQILLIIYVVIGITMACYIAASHLYATWQYIKQLYTARFVTPTKIKTYFGLKYWIFWDADFWGEIVLVSTLIAAAFTIGSVLAWPVGIIFVLNHSIQKARERLEG